MPLKKLVCLLFLFAASAFGTVTATTQWDIRTTGNDQNGGCFDPGVVSPGTDYSQQNSPQVAYTDLTSPSTTTLTSVLNPFTSADVGNCLWINGSSGGGAGFNGGWFVVLSVSGVTATMSSAVSGGVGTGGVGNLGGSLQDFSTAVGGLRTSDGCTNGPGFSNQVNTVWMKSGTYSTGTSLVSNKCLYWFGYNTTHGDNTGRPTYTFTASASGGMLDFYGSDANLVIGNIIFDGTGQATTAIWPFNAPSQYGTVTLLNDKFIGFTNIIDNSANSGYAWYTLNVFGCEFTGAATNAFVTSNTGGKNNNFVGNYFHANNQDLAVQGGNAFVSNNVFTGTTQTGPATQSVYFTNISGGNYLILVNNVFYNIATVRVIYSVSQSAMQIFGNVFYGNNIPIENDGQFPTQNPYMTYSNAFGNNAFANIGWVNSPSDVTLTANPFTNPSGGDFSINSAGGGGALLKATNYPGTTLWGSKGYLDIGAFQHGGTVGPGIFNYGYVN